MTNERVATIDKYKFNNHYNGMLNITELGECYQSR